MTTHKSGFLKNLRYDLPSSIVVFLVAMPLCLGIALASGAPLFSGIIAGIVGGIVVGLLSGSPLGVSGPAAGLAVIVLSSIQEIGSFEVFLFAVVVAGIFQLGLGLAKAGVIGYYFPSSVIKGMLAGIGIIIILKQIPHAFGYDKDPSGDFAFSQIDGHTTLSELWYMFDFINFGVIIISVVSLAILIVWELPAVRKFLFFRRVQGPLVVVLTGIGLNLAFQGTLVSLQPEQLVSIPVADSLGQFFGQFSFPDFSQWANPRIYVIAATIAVVASLETLLCVEATDKLDPERRVTPTNRELLAQGTGNVISGLIGGLPITQVIVRSSANIQSGGRSKSSAVIHGVFLLLSAMAIPAALNLIPLASLAAILLVVGFKLARPSLFREMYAKGKGQFITYTVTILGIIFTDLLIGIGMGLVVGIMQILWHNYRVPYHVATQNLAKGEPITMHLSENVSFLNKASIMRTLNKMPDESHVIIDASKTVTIHPDILEIIEDFRRNAETRDIVLELVGFDTDGTTPAVEQFGRVVLVHPASPEKSATPPEPVSTT